VTLGEYGLLEAFCAGAGLDSSSFAAEESHEVMRRAGAFYRQSILGLADLLGERTAMKRDYALERTTIGSAGNNPIKWAAPQRLAVDLLCDGDGQFLKDAAAANEAFADVKKHLVCLTTAMRAVLDECLRELAPQNIKAASGESGFSLKRSSERCWAEFERRFYLIAGAASEEVSPRIRAAYEQHMAALNRKAGEH
jgi:type VI secretion system FHA domain protein